MKKNRIPHFKPNLIYNNMPKKESEIIERWEKDTRKFLVGKKIQQVRYMTDSEQEHFGWYNKGIVIFFTDGSHILPSADDEGNNAGALFTSDEVLPIIPVI